MVRLAFPLALALCLAPGPIAAESLSMSFVPHPAHETVVAGEMVPVTLRAVYDRKIALQALEVAPSDSFDWIQVAPDRWREERIDGKAWITMERDLVVVPRRSGPLRFGPATHTLTIIDEESQRQDRVVVAPPICCRSGPIRRSGAGSGWPRRRR